MKFNGQIAILCGGRGTRLRPKTDVIPKALIQLNRRPILEYILDYYYRNGLRRFVICVGYKGESIKKFFPRNKFKNADLFFSDLGSDASMFQRIYALQSIMENNFIVCYGDTLLNLDIKSLKSVHNQSKSLITIVTANIRNPFGLVRFDEDGWVKSFDEKPMLDYYIGTFMIKKVALVDSSYYCSFPDGQGLVLFFQKLAQNKKLLSFEHKGPQITFNTELERRLAQKDLGRFFTFTEDNRHESTKK